MDLLKLQIQLDLTMKQKKKGDEGKVVNIE